MMMSCFSEHDAYAFKAGWDAWDHYIISGEKLQNPYIYESNGWYSWNKGWNLNQ